MLVPSAHECEGRWSRISSKSIRHACAAVEAERHWVANGPNGSTRRSLPGLQTLRTTKAAATTHQRFEDRPGREAVMDFTISMEWTAIVALAIGSLGIGVLAQMYGSPAG